MITLSNNPKTKASRKTPSQTRPHYSPCVFVFVWNLTQSLWLVMGWLTHQDKIHANPYHLCTLMLLFKHRRSIHFPLRYQHSKSVHNHSLHVNKLKHYSKTLSPLWHVRVRWSSSLQEVQLHCAQQKQTISELQVKNSQQTVEMDGLRRRIEELQQVSKEKRSCQKKWQKVGSPWWFSLVVFAWQRILFHKKLSIWVLVSLYICTVSFSLWAVGAGHGSCEPGPGWKCSGSGPGRTIPPPPAASSAEPLRNLQPCRS